jgi:hypothetical protein
MRAVWFTLAATVSLTILPPVRADDGPRRVDFRRDVVPILQAHCFECHRGKSAAAGFRLDQRADLLGETTGKPLVKPGHAADSRLIKAVTGQTPNRVMPKDAPRLAPAQIAVLRAWIDEGLAWDDALFPPETARSDHWAFQPVRRPALPVVKNAAWVRTPVDAFVAAKHEAEGLRPAPEADRRTLLRRLSLDLTGLPPTPAEVDAFVSDTSPQAYDRLVERLLASPHYGERWGRHWLDVARWAESEGYESNHLRPYAWRYRDWVVRAFNNDMPFADFVRAQLAGDEITPYADDNLVATGFLAAARLSSNEEDRWRQRNDVQVDVVNATASAFLGLTMQCAQCHSHKFDPITARDYYRFQGFFVKGQPGNLALRDPRLWAEYDARKPAGYDDALRERDELYALGRRRRLDAVRKTLSDDQLRALALPMAERTMAQEKTAREADLLFQLNAGQIENALRPDERKRYDALKKQVAALEKGMADKPQTFGFYSPATSPHRVELLPMKGFYPLTYEPAELARARPYLLAAGDVHQPSFPVDVGWPAVFGPAPAEAIAGHPRWALADWLAGPDNPLAARVYVNRVWQYHFGRGVVATPNDFGIKGAAPTHPALLDWLASEFTRSGGSTKHLHRLIVTSSTYRQASRGDADSARRDPDNHFWHRWQPRRLEAEAIRDSYLAVAGDLDPRVGGPSAPADGKSRRRGLYLLQKRDVPPYAQGLFDGPAAMTESCGRRQVTTVALQPLYLLNSAFSTARARALALVVRREAGDDTSRLIDAAFRQTLGRLPDAAERAAARRFFDAADAQTTDVEEVSAALVSFCQAMLNLDEFVYLD